MGSICARDGDPFTSVGQVSGGGVLKEEEVEVGGTMGLRLGVSLKLNLEANGRAVPSRQVEAERKSSQPLLRVAPGPWGWARVAESTWPVFFFLHSALV